jgi:hypothetical protein
MKNHYFFAPMIGVDETRGNVQFCFLAKNQDAEQIDADLLGAKLQAYAFMGAADSPAEKGTARFVDGSIQAKSDRVAFSMRVHDDNTLKLLKRESYRALWCAPTQDPAVSSPSTASIFGTTAS